VIKNLLPPKNFDSITSHLTPKPKGDDFPDINFREDIANELTRNELIERCCDMKLHYDEMRKEWFEKTQLKEPKGEDDLIQKVKVNSDTHKCLECGGRTALITGTFYYEQDAEPYMSGIEEDAKVSSGDCWVGGYICDDCGNVQGLWHE
jgi:hypothetical protein